MKIIYFILVVYSCNLFASERYKIESDAYYRINELKARNINYKDNIGDNIVHIADYFYRQGSSYKSNLLDMESYEYLYLSTSNTDCFIFAEEVLAIAFAIRENKLTKVNVLKYIQMLRYGNNDEVLYCNRNHYFKQWVIDNKDFIDDVGYDLTKQYYPYKVGILSSYIIEKEIVKNRKQYINCIMKNENQINRESIGFIPFNELKYFLKNLKNGDIIGIVKEVKKADNISHILIAYRNGNNIGAYHASSKLKMVIKEENIMNYLQNVEGLKGIVLVRAI